MGDLLQSKRLILLLKMWDEIPKKQMIYLKQFMLATPKLHVTKQCNQENKYC